MHIIIMRKCKRMRESHVIIFIFFFNFAPFQFHQLYRIWLEMHFKNHKTHCSYIMTSLVKLVYCLRNHITAFLHFKSQN